LVGGILHLSKAVVQREMDCIFSAFRDAYERSFEKLFLLFLFVSIKEVHSNVEVTQYLNLQACNTIDRKNVPPSVQRTVV